VASDTFGVLVDTAVVLFDVSALVAKLGGKDSPGRRLDEGVVEVAAPDADEPAAAGAEFTGVCADGVKATLPAHAVSSTLATTAASEPTPPRCAHVQAGIFISACGVNGSERILPTLLVKN
jgi:hypothetical protein